MRLLLLAALCAGTLGCGASYELSREYKQGEVSRTEATLSVPRGDLTIDVGSQTISGTYEMRVTSVTELDLLAVKKGQPIRVKITHLAGGTESILQSAGGPPERGFEADPLLGRSVLFEKKGAQWQPKLVGGVPDERQKAALDEHEPPCFEDYVPGQKLQVGDSWTVSGDRLGHLFGMAPDRSAGTMKAHFEQVLEYQGDRCALFSVQFDVSGKILNSTGEPMAATFSGEGHIYRSLVKKIDVRLELSGTVRLEMDMNADGQNGRLILNGPFSMEETSTKE